MITLLTTLEVGSDLLKVVEGTGLISAVLRSREELEQVGDASVLLINWPYILREDFIARQRIVLNVHNSLLPRYRGRHAFTWAILNGERRLGFSLHEVVVAVDAGDVLSQTSFELLPEADINDAFRIGEKVLEEWLPRALNRWASGLLTPSPQDEGAASLFRRRRPEDNWIASFDSAERVRDLVRAVAPPYTPGAMCRTQAGEILYFSSAQVVEGGGAAAPGSVLGVDMGALLVACAQGVVRLTLVESHAVCSVTAGDVLCAALH